VKRSRFTEQQIAYALKQQELGVCGRGDLPQAWDFRCDLLQVEEEVFGPGAAGAATAEAARGREHQAQRLVADLSLDKAMLQDVVRESLDAGTQAELVGSCASGTAPASAKRARR